MALEVIIRREGQRLAPASRIDAEMIEELPAGADIAARLWRPRSLQQHRLAFALFGLLAEALNEGPGHEFWTQDSVRRRLLIATGHADVLPLPDRLAKQWGSRLAVVPRSMAFGAMDADEFRRFLDAAMDYVRTTLAPWIEDAPQWEEIRKIVEGAS